VLILPDPHAPYELIADASDFALGGVLLQHGKPIAFESRKFAPAELNYSAGEKEMLAVIHCLRVWRCYLEGCKGLTLVTDHQPNTYLGTTQVLSRRQSRWVEFLERFHYQWVYRPGRANMADPLSRIDNPVKVTADPGSGSLELGGRKITQPVTEPNDTNLGVAEKDSSFAGLQTMESAGTQLSACKLVTHELSDLVAEIKRGYEADAWLERRKSSSRQELHFAEGVWLTKDNVVYVPNTKELRSKVISKFHDPLWQGHMGIAKTIQALVRAA